jgi:hypothetical protein
MMTLNIQSVRYSARFGCFLTAGLLLIGPLVQADTDQLQKALIQTEATLMSLDQGDAQVAAAHAAAARTHLEIAARDATGQTIRDMSACQKQLKEAEQRSKKDQRDEARVAATKARDRLQQWAGN